MYYCSILNSFFPSYTNCTHKDFVHGLTWSSKSQLYTCAWDSKVLLHDISSKVASVMGQSTTSAVKMNGDIGHNSGSGDAAEDKDKLKSEQWKSYSQVVKTEISAEG